MDTVEYVELFWDCPKCGQPHISAVLNPQGNRCPNCLYWRTEDIKLYEASDSQIITDPKLINRKPFWICKICHAVNEETGLPAHLLQCGSCDAYQTSEVGGITGNQAIDRQIPESAPVGEPVEFRGNTPNSHPQNLVHIQPPKKGSGRRLGWLAAGLTGLTLVGGGILGSSIWSSQMSNPAILKVQVTDLRWTVEADVQEQKTFTRQAWDDSVPAGASMLKSETRQRRTRQEQRGLRTVMIEERYQSGTRAETYTEPEQYQSGTRAETYTEPERYQSGTRAETYTESERYRSGIEQKCQTTTQGNGIGKRVCRDMPVYSTRQVQRTRTVPVYSNRQIQRTRYVSVYSTRQVQRTRTFPVYSTRMVPVQEPIVVSIPVYDTWITYQLDEWIFRQTYKQTGQDDAPRRIPAIKLTQIPLQRLSATRTTCHLYGLYTVPANWFQNSKLKSGKWSLPCQEYDRINIGDRVQFRRSGTNSVKLVKINSYD